MWWMLWVLLQERERGGSARGASASGSRSSQYPCPGTVAATSGPHLQYGDDDGWG